MVARLRGFFESSGAFPTKETAASIDIERSRFVKHEGLVAKHSLTKSKKPLRYQGRGRGGTGRRKGLKIPRWQRRVGSSPTARTNLDKRSEVGMPDENDDLFDED